MKLGECPTCHTPASVAKEFNLVAHDGGVDCCKIVVLERWACAGKPQHFYDQLAEEK